MFSLQTSVGRRSHTCDSRLNCNLFFIFYFWLHKYRRLFLTPWCRSPRAMFCLVLFTLIVWGALIKKFPCSHLSSDMTTLPRHYHIIPPLPTRGCLMYHASRRIYNVQAAAAAAGNLNMSPHNSIGCSTARAPSYPAVGRADLRG